MVGLLTCVLLEFASVLFFSGTGNISATALTGDSITTIGSLSFSPTTIVCF
jgi:hypothetical protein